MSNLSRTFCLSTRVALLTLALCAVTGASQAQSPNAGGVPGTPGAARSPTDGSGRAADAVDRAALQEYAASKAARRAVKRENALAVVAPPLCDGCGRVTGVQKVSRELKDGTLGADGTGRQTVWVTTVETKGGAARRFEAAAEPQVKVDDVVRINGRSIELTRN